MAESSYPNAKQLLKEEFALNAKTTQDDLLNDKTCLRYWREIPMGRVKECLDFLRNITSVNNNKTGHSVTDPQINKEKLPGVWRHIQEYAQPPRPGSEPDVQDVYQLLKLGWAETIDWTEARLIEGDNQPLQPERTLRVQFVNLDYTKLGAMIESIETTKYFTDPVIAGETYDGPEGAHLKWRVLSAKPSRADDGSGVITLTLAKNLVMTPDALPTPVLLTDDKVLLSPFAHDTTSVKNAYVWEYRWIDPDYVQTLRDTISLISGVIDAKAVKSDDGSCNIQVLTQSNTWNGDLSQVWERETQSPGFAAEKIVNTYSHIALTSLDEFKTTLGTATDGYKVSSLIDSTDETRGFAKIIQTQDKLFSGAVTDANGTLNEEEYLQLITGGVIRTTMWLGVADADLATAMATVAVAPDGYVVLKAGNNYSGTGSFTMIRIMMLKASDTVPMQVRVEFPEFDDERRTYFYFGLDKTTAESTYTDCKTDCDAGYKVDSVEIQEWRYGSLAVIQQISKINLLLTGQVRAYDYTKTFGLVNVATTVYLNIAKASIDGLKTDILTDTDIIVLDIRDEDVGQGKANVLCTWRSKETAPRSLGAIRATKASQFHKTEEDRLWIDVNLEDTTSLSDAVAQALAGTAPYTVAATEEVREVDGEDAGDKTARIRQRVIKGTGTAADYSMQESFNPHGLQEAVMVVSVREYPEVDYTNVAAVFALLQTFLGTPAKGRIQVSMNGNGTFSMRALKEGKPDWGNTTPNYVKVAVQNKGLIGESKDELATGVPVADAAAIVDAAVADTDHIIEDIRMTERGQGEAAIEKKQTKKSETAVQVEETPSLGLRRAAQNYTWPLVLSENIDTIWAAALVEGVTGDYVLHYRQKNILGNGMFSITSQVVECTEKKQNYTVAYTDNSVVTVEICQDAAAMPTIEDTAGTEEKLDGGLNLFNKYDYVKTTVTSRVPKSCALGATWNVRGSYYTVEGYTFQIVTTPGEKSYYWHSSTDTWQVQEIHTISYHLTAAEAALVVHTYNNGSGIHPVGGNLWMAHKVERSDLYIGQVTYNSPE